jgi:tetratricopeptide (TPR) repeat protein
MQPARPILMMFWVAVLQALAWSTSSAASGFIESSNISTGDVYTEITIRLGCDVTYLGHLPSSKGDTLTIDLETTAICHGVPPSLADSREMHRPQAADEAGLLHVEYDGERPGQKQLRLSFADEVHFLVTPGVLSETVVVRVLRSTGQAVAAPTASGATGRQVSRATAPPARFVINLESSLRYPATADIPVMTLETGQKLFITEAEIDGKTWYRMRVGYFESADAAAKVLRDIRDQYPTAWIDRDAAEGDAVKTVDAIEVASASAPAEPVADGESEQLMADAKRAMTAGEISRAVQIYTKVLQQPANAQQQAAQEYLALARERNGQLAHAKAEYERYLDLYPEGPGTERVRQRLAALLAASTGTPVRSAGGGDLARSEPSLWKVRTFLSQHYRRDANQLNDQEEVTSQSSLYSDVSVDARRRGERFDLSTRLTGGHRYDLLDEDTGSSGNDFRLSYLYADLYDTRTRLRGRLGRQTRSTGGVLGRFDGLNVSYSLNDQVRFDAVAGQPVYSTANSDEQSRQFYGVSSNFTPFVNNLEFGVFYLQQEIDSLTDRQAVGSEVRYFGESVSAWGSVDYDMAFDELSSAFVQGSWRLPGKLTLSGSLDRRRSPFLSLGNALLGQSSQDFGLLTQTLDESQIRQQALDRSPLTSSTTLGLSRPLTPHLQLNINANRSLVDAMPASGDAPATPETEYSYFSTDLVASSLFREGDVGILSLRYATSDSADIYTVSLDSRFPIGQRWRINPRLRVDYREIFSDMSTQWTYTPGLRLQYRLGRQGRIELDAGKRFSTRDMVNMDQDQESYFISLGYQLHY